MEYDNNDGRLRGRKLQAARLRIWSADPHCARCRKLVAYPHGFELYRPDNYERPVSTTETDVKDAIVIQAAVRELPERQRKAIQWFYVQPTNPVRRARELKVGTRGLYELVCEARCELVRRGY